MVKVSLWVWAQVIVWLVVAVLASSSPIPMKGGVNSKGKTVPQTAASPTSVPQTVSSSTKVPQDAAGAADVDSYDYEYGYATVQVLVALDSAPRKIQKPCKSGYKPRRGKCRRVANVERR